MNVSTGSGGAVGCNGTPAEVPLLRARPRAFRGVAQFRGERHRHIDTDALML
jgi:hypothetical protein